MMKTKVAMAISLAGVLAAGTAAALVNTHVLNGGASTPLAVSAPQSQQTSPAQAASSPPGVSTAAVPAGATPPVAASPTQATYAIGDSGTVTLDTAGDVLKIVAVAPAANWTVSQSETSDASDADVKFQSGNTEVEFQANLLYGVVRTSVETRDLSATTGTVGGGSDDSGQGNGLQGGDGVGGDD